MNTFDRAQGPGAGWQAMVWALSRDAVMCDAEAYANGWRSVTVVHGDPESPDDEDRLQQLRETAQRAGAPVQHPGPTRIVGTNDTTTWWLPPFPDTQPPRPADDVAEAIARAAHTLNPGWWRIHEVGMAAGG